ncbi:uncharacterized protein LOC121051353 [Rosa chinensis]|uniref:uncharacterized protein LOC121051353 n=1 Tax=Rosa chinensis TaxID=74649 RepID=UPI001AD90ED1|nr:uncharacterized protein LOC121051353 [Rosa chinensis]
MSNEPRLDFQMLDSTGSEYYSWVTDVENHLTSRGILPIIQAPNPGLVFQRTPTKHAQAIILMRRHMDKALRLEYMSMRDARDLWVALEERFGNIQDTLLPDLKVQWNNIRFSDFKSVAEYNSEALRLQAMLKFCGKPLTEDELLEKTLSTIPISAIVISKPIGTKSVREANYNAPKKGRKQQYPNNKGQERRTGPYNHPNKERNRNFKVDTRGGNFTRGGNSTRGNFTRGGNSTRGRGEYNNNMGHGGRIIRRGSSSNPPREYPQHGETAPPMKGGNHNDVCHRCGSIEHWLKQCRASTKLAASYKEYRQNREQESNLAEMKIVKMSISQ